jgi:hypothetical protein
MVVQPLEIRTIWSALMVIPCLDIRASLLPWDAHPALQMLPLSSPARPPLFSLLLSQQEKMDEQPTMGGPSCPNRPHEGR